MRLFYVICYVVFYQSLLAQKFDNVWVLGWGGGNQTTPKDNYGALLIDFKSGLGPVLTERQDYDMNMDITNTSISDSIGGLLFYTNGEKIYNNGIY